jgi:Domain of Unknown Function with PDB structure (DUF3857)
MLWVDPESDSGKTRMLSQKYAASAIRVPISRDPVPSWVRHAPYNRPAAADEAFVSGGICRVLQDFQTDLSGPQIAFHTRTANYVVTPEGAAAAAQVAADFDPYYQRVEFHHVRVLRGGAAIDCTNIESFRVQRRERDSERRSIDGRLTAAMTIPGVRPGDTVEVCLTVYGTHPVLKGHFSSWVAIDGTEPVLDLRHRLRHGPDRNLVLKPINGAPAPLILEKDGTTEYLWGAQRRGRFVYEPLSPPWAIQGAVTQISDGAAWADIAALFGQLDGPEPLPQALHAEIEALAREHPAAGERAVEALRFVQTRLRHHSIPFSEGSLALRPLAEVWAVGHGDCKDAARLFTAIARALKLNACPALVSTSHGPILDTLLPAVNVFDHCIARVKVDGKTYWLDPSLRPQSGDLNMVVQPYRGQALPLSQDSEGLEDMNPAAPLIVAETDERVEFGPYVATQATLRRKTVYASWRADHLRDTIARDGEPAFSAAAIAALAKVWPGLAEHVPLRVEDEPHNNRLTVIESYKLPPCWRKSGGTSVSFGTHDTIISRELALLPEGPRTTDIHLGRPRVVRRFVHLHMPANWACKPWDRKIEMPGLIYRSKMQRKTKRLLVFAQLVAVTAETAPASEARRYNEIVRAIGEQCDITLLASNRNGEIRQQGQGIGRLVWAACGLFALAALGAAGFILYAG